MPYDGFRLLPPPRRHRLSKLFLLLMIGVAINLIIPYSVLYMNLVNNMTKQEVGNSRSLHDPMILSSSFSNQKDEDKIRPTFSSTSTTSNHHYPPPIFSACLLVMDDGHYLQEYLAYHYHTLNLRKVIVAMDPNSQTSPVEILHRWKDLINITFWWNETQYTTPSEFESTLIEVKEYFRTSLSSSSPTLAYHKARQRIFYQQCLRRLKDEEMGWTLLTDTDEYLTIHYKLVRQQNLPHVLTPDQPGSVAQFIQQYSQSSTSTHTSSSNSTNNYNNNSPCDNLQSSPCLQVPRIRYGAKESNAKSLPIPVGGGEGRQWWNESDFLTLRWKYHAKSGNHRVNKISKAIIDLSRISKDFLMMESLTSIHLPIRTFCSQPRLHTAKENSFLILHHYLGSLEQYQYRENDARISSSSTSTSTNTTGGTRSVMEFKKQSRQSSIVADDDDNNDGIRSWWKGFLQQHPTTTTSNNNNNMNNDIDPVNPRLLLQDVGRLQPKSWTTYLGNSNQERCALCFFGLPRAYASMVLPSIIQNILIPNARHNCDVFVHFYQQTKEPEGRFNRGGDVDPTQIYRLEQAVYDVQREYGPKRPEARTFRNPTVAFTYDTEESFWEIRGTTIQKYQTAKDSNGLKIYFPYKATTYLPASVDNIVKQWHSIESSFHLMMNHSKNNEGSTMDPTNGNNGHGGQVEYTRVGMFRSDAMYVTPIDIALYEGPGMGTTANFTSGSTTTALTDSQNRYGIQPGFAQMPANDRMFYGPYKAVEIWATRRFEAVEERARLQPEPGYTMHSERFLNSSIFPMIKKEGNEQGRYRIVSNRDICFLRVRSDESVMINDCSRGDIMTRGRWNDDPTLNKQSIVEGIVGRNCTKFQLEKSSRWACLGCALVPRS